LLKLLLQVPVDTIIYMVAGYVFIFSALLIYLASLFVRRRNLMRALRALQKMQEHGD
jgi:hypothetical protein